MSAPRTKRQFAGAASDPAQRQITAFFNKTGSPAGLAPDGVRPAHATAPLNGPALPSQVQSNLLSVGMRVRKSVPEGYKTGTSYGTFSLWADADARPTLTAPSKPLQSLHTSSGPSTPTSRELSPFCGIHKVGGLAVQESTPSHSLFPPAAFGASLDDVPSIDDVPGLTSSQESIVSTEGNGGLSQTSRKRFFTEDDDATSADVPGLHGSLRARDASWWDAEISPRSLAPASWDNARVMAVPRRRSGRKGAAVGPTDSEQENTHMTDDFEEAAFLDYSLGEGMDVE